MNYNSLSNPMLHYYLVTSYSSALLDRLLGRLFRVDLMKPVSMSVLTSVRPSVRPQNVFPISTKFAV